MGIFQRLFGRDKRKVTKFRHAQTGITVELDLESSLPRGNSPVVESAPKMSPEDAAQLFFDRMAEFSPSSTTDDRPVVAEAIDTVEGVSHDFGEETTVDEIFAHHIRRRFFRPRDTSLRGRMLTITILGELRDGSVAWIGDDSSAYGNCAVDVLALESPQVGDEVRAKVVSHAWGHSIAAVDPHTHVTASEVQSRSTRDVSTNTSHRHPAPGSVMGSWRALLKPGDVVLAHVSFDGTYGFRGGVLHKNRPAAFVGWGDDYAVVRPIYGVDTMVARNDVAEPLLERGCLVKDSAIRRTAYDIHPDFMLKKLGRLGDRDIVRFGFGRAPQLPTISPDEVGSQSEPERRKKFIPGRTPILYAASTEPWKVACREAATEPQRYPYGKSADELLVLYLMEICASPDVWEVLGDTGVDYAALATALKLICDERGISTKGESFAGRMDRAISTFNESSDRKIKAFSQGDDLVWFLRADD